MKRSIFLFIITHYYQDCLWLRTLDAAEEVGVPGVCQGEFASSIDGPHKTVTKEDSNC